MADALIYDVDKIENLYQDFEKCQKNFKNKEYDDFRSSYFYSCSDSVIVKLRNRIQTIYDNIQKGYDMIDKVWKEYIDDVGNFDKSIASGGNCGIHDGGVSSIVSRLCSIELYDSASVGTYFKSVSSTSLKTIGSTLWGILKSTAASIVNVTVFGIVSGLLKFVEGIVDCAVMIVGAVVGLPVLIFDGVKSLVTGKKDFSNSKKYYNKLMQCVGYDIVENKIKGKFYETRFGKWFNENSYAPFRSDGTAYKVSETIGEIVGTAILTIATMGAGAGVTAAKSAATAGTKIGVKAATKAAVQGAATALKSAATTTATNLFASAATKEAAKIAAKEATKIATKEAAKIAAKEAAKKQLTVFAVRSIGKTGMQAQKNYNDFLKNNKEVNKGELSGGQIVKLMLTSGAQGVTDGAAYALTYGNGLKTLGMKNAKAITAAKAGIQFSKQYINDGTAAAAGIKEFNISETHTDALINAGVSVAYDALPSFGLKKLDKTLNADNSIPSKPIEFSGTSNGISGNVVDGAGSKGLKQALNVIKDKAFDTAKNVVHEAATGDDAKKVVGTIIKKGPTNTLDEVLDF